MRSIVNLYRASLIAFPGEKVMEEAEIFSTKYLKEALQKIPVSSLSREVRTINITYLLIHTQTTFVGFFMRFSVFNCRQATFWNKVGTQICHDWKQGITSTSLDRTLRIRNCQQHPFIALYFSHIDTSSFIYKYFEWILCFVSRKSYMKTEKLLELAKLEFNIFQSLQKGELESLLR